MNSQASRRCRNECEQQMMPCCRDRGMQVQEPPMAGAGGHLDVKEQRGGDQRSPSRRLSTNRLSVPCPKPNLKARNQDRQTMPSLALHQSLNRDTKSPESSVASQITSLLHVVHAHTKATCPHQGYMPILHSKPLCCILLCILHEK